MYSDQPLQCRESGNQVPAGACLTAGQGQIKAIRFMDVALPPKTAVIWATALPVYLRSSDFN